MHDIPVTRVMSTKLATTHPSSTLESAAAQMEAEHIHHLLVTDGGVLVGLVSSADFLKVALLRRLDVAPQAARPEPHFQMHVSDVMQRHLVKMPESASLSDVAKALAIGGFHALPIVAASGAPVGIVTSTDLVIVLMQQIERGVVQQGMSGPAAHDKHALEAVLHAADVYLHSGQSEQQHAALVRAVQRAKETTRALTPAGRL
jgi:CBS domain-containing protein